VHPALPGWVRFVPRPYPSSNLVLLTGPTPVMLDPGYGSDAGALDELLGVAGLTVAQLALVLNSHWHSDHSGGNAWLEARGVPIAAARLDGEAVNRCDPSACEAEWLDQPVEQYHVEILLDGGDRLRAGEADWEVLATPGHTPCHLSFYQPDEQVLLIGDALHADDVGWINLALDGPGAIGVAMQTMERLAALPTRYCLSGHGPRITDPPAAFAQARTRYERMQADPSRAAWHGMKRIFAYALMIADGLPLDSMASYLTSRAWLIDHATRVLNVTPEVLAEDLLAEMRRARAVVERDGMLYPLTPYTPPAPGWRHTPSTPRDWA
jgi:glyoxylase-like metal-dependent hydrolase (beta-lactamase superfamily II)